MNAFREDSVLLVVDVQERLLAAMASPDRLQDRVARLAKGAAALKLPIVISEQVPEKLGPTPAAILEAAPDAIRLSKKHFSCLRDPRMAETLAGLRRHTIWLAGIEAHVCIYQTARDLLAAGYRVEAIEDAITSRALEDRRVGLERIRILGGGLMSVEMALFDALDAAEGEDFQAIRRIVK